MDIVTGSDNPWFGNTELGILTINHEDYNGHYRNINVKDLVVLDLGCDWGSTAVFFMEKGAKRIIGVDSYLPSLISFNELIKNHFEGKMKTLGINLDSTIDFEMLIWAYHPDMVKSDIEGAEEFMKNIRPEILRIPKYYAIEFHNNEEGSVTKHFIDCRFEITDEFRWLDAVVVKYFRRID